MSVPKLRFREFIGTWELFALKDKVDLLAGFAFDSKLMSSKPSKYQLIKMANVYQNELGLHRNPSYWDNLDDSNRKYLLKKGDIVLTLTGTIGKRDYGYSIDIDDDDRFLINQRLVRIREIHNKSTNKFIRYLVSTERFFFQFFSCSKGGTGNQNNVSIEDIKVIKLYFPSLPEQTKIANFLTAVDEKISQLTQKYDLLKQYKKGVMQQIFSQKLRFKDDDGREFPEWENATFAEANIKVIDGDRGDNYPNGCDFFDDGYCLFLNAKNVTKSGFVFNETSFITKQKDELLRKGKLVRGDLILTTRGTVGNVAYFDENIKYENIRINSGMVIIRAHNKEISPNYLYKYFDSPKFKKTIDQIAFGSAQPQLTVAEINKFVVKFPIPKEQTKIANFLTAIDDKITQAQTQLEAVKQYKKGLLQQLFV